MAAEANVKAGAFLGFKVGLQADVDTMLAAGSSAGAQHGCFYLTKDSHRLYIGNEDTSLSAVNEGIETVTWSQLESIASSIVGNADAKKALTGRFYYASDQNILCVYNGTNFVQLNENTNTYVDGHSMAVSAASNVATVTSTVENSSGQDFSDSFTVTGANGITITGSGKAMTISGDTYTLSSEQSGADVNLKLDSTNTSNDSSVKLKAGTNVTLSKAANAEEITISSANTTNASLVIDELGSSTTPTTGFKVTITDSVGAAKSDTVDPTVSWYTDASASGTTTDSAHFANGNAVLDVYSRAAVDSKLQAVNAMTYRGKVGTSGDAVASSISYSNGVASIVDASSNPVAVSIGDTFLAETDGSYNGVAYKAGSLFIARSTDGTEQADGTIAASKLAFDVVAEQFSSDTNFTLVPITDGVKLVASTGGEKGAFKVVSGDAFISTSEATTGTSPNQTKTITLTHANVTRTDGTGTAVTQTAKGSVTIPVVTGVTSDAKGHVTGVEVTDYTLTDTNGTLSSMSSSTSVDANNTKGTITVGATFTQSNGSTLGNTPSTSFTVSSSSLKIEDDDANGGTPAGIAINMVWGSF